MDKLPDTISRTLDALAARFGATGHALLIAYVHYIQWYAIACLVTGSAACVLMFVQVRRLPQSHDNFDKNVLEFLRAVVLCILIIVGCVFVGANFADIVDPTGAAVFYLVHR